MSESDDPSVAAEIPALLADGSVPATPEELFARLADLGIAATTEHHRAVFTVEESHDLREQQVGGHTKNLLLRNNKKQRKKTHYWLLLCRAEIRVDLKALAAQIGCGRFSFGRPEELMKVLGVQPGAVTPFAVVNDHAGAAEVLIDRALLPDHGGQDPLLVHPLRNTMTTGIAAADLLRFLAAADHPPRFVDP